MENTSNKKELPKGTCPSCWGKGSYSQMVRETGLGDFIGDKNYDSGSHIVNKPCSKCKGTGKYPNTPKEEDESIKMYNEDVRRGVVMRNDDIPPKEEEKWQCNDCLTIFTGIGDEFCPECNGIMSKIIHTPQNITSKESWIEEFKGICRQLNLREETISGFDEIGYLNNFITKLLTQRDQEWAKHLENIVETHIGKTPEQAIQEIISKMIK